MVALRLLAPRAGDVWEKDTTVAIRWQATDVKGDVDLLLTKSPTSRVRIPICRAVPAQLGEFSYELPDRLQWPQAHVIVAARDGSAMDIAAEPVKIIPPRRLRLLCPSAFTRWRRGAKHYALWEARDIDNVSVRLLERFGRYRTLVIAESVPAVTGRCVFEVPGDFDWRTAVLEVATSDRIVRAHSALIRFLDRQLLRVIEPNGGETWRKGRTHTIRWGSNGVGGDVVVKLKGGGDSPGGWFTVRERVPVADGQCEYTLPCNFGWAEARAYVGTPDGVLEDFSNAPFNIDWPNVLELEKQLRAHYAAMAYFQENPLVKAATVDAFDRLTLFSFCTSLATLENHGMLEVDVPQALQACQEPEPCAVIALTQREVRNIRAAKAAHAVWMDRNEKVPWRLGDYTADELGQLFDPEELFNGPEDMRTFYGIVDHSPSEVYKYAVEHDLVQATRFETLVAMLRDLRGRGSEPRFIHGSQLDPRTAQTLLEALTFTKMSGPGPVRVSRGGCHTSGRISVGMLRALNIPGVITTAGDWFPAGHCSAVWSVLERVMPHGDDIYNALLLETPETELLPEMAFYEDPANQAVCGTDRSCLSRRHRSLLAVTYVSSYASTRCCNAEDYGYENCEEYIADEFGAYLTDGEVDDAVATVSATCR